MKITLNFPEKVFTDRKIQELEVDVLAVPKQGEVWTWRTKDQLRAYLVGNPVYRQKENTHEWKVVVPLLRTNTNPPTTYFITGKKDNLRPYWGDMFARGQVGPCSVFLVCFKPGSQHYTHFHPLHDEIIYVAKGSIAQTIGDKTKILNAGDSAIIPKNVLHSARPNPADSEAEVVVVLSGEKDYVSIEIGHPEIR